MTPASDSSRLISSNRSSSFSSLRRMESFMAANYSGLISMLAAFFGQKPGHGLRQSQISQFRGLAQGLCGGMQQPVGEGGGQKLDDLVAGFTGSDHAPRLLNGLPANPVGLLAQRADRRARVMRARV